jgi:hypothetical protein
MVLASLPRVLTGATRHAEVVFPDALAHIKASDQKARCSFSQSTSLRVYVGSIEETAAAVLSEVAVNNRVLLNARACLPKPVWLFGPLSGRQIAENESKTSKDSLR